MVEVGEDPILIHIMRWYYRHGFNDFVICAGYKAWEIKRYFLNYRYRKTHLEIDFREGSRVSGFGAETGLEKWRVRVVDTGLNTQTGGRVARAWDEITDGVSEDAKPEHFALTYGDGLCDVNLTEELAFHFNHGKTGTILGTPPRARFGELDVKGTSVSQFLEKPQSRQGLINGGFFFFNREFRKYLSDEESCVLEKDPLARLAESGGLEMFRHSGFWQPMDTLRDRHELEAIWAKGAAPWRP